MRAMSINLRVEQGDYTRVTDVSSKDHPHIVALGIGPLVIYGDLPQLRQILIDLTEKMNQLEIVRLEERDV